MLITYMQQTSEQIKDSWPLPGSGVLIRKKNIALILNERRMEHIIVGNDNYTWLYT